ncbi:protein of unknown function [Nitrosomonas sp. Nm34]|nr:protein of unknown function [Nitrosomonas sp. Nm34]
MANSSAPKEATAKFEIRFMEGMIGHHAMGVQMTQICIKKDIQDELKSLCNSNQPAAGNQTNARLAERLV